MPSAISLHNKDLYSAVPLSGQANLESLFLKRGMLFMEINPLNYMLTCLAAQPGVCAEPLPGARCGAFRLHQHVRLRHGSPPFKQIL